MAAAHDPGSTHRPSAQGLRNRLRKGRQRTFDLSGHTACYAEHIHQAEGEEGSADCVEARGLRRYGTDCISGAGLTLFTRPCR